MNKLSQHNNSIHISIPNFEWVFSMLGTLLHFPAPSYTELADQTRYS